MFYSEYYVESFEMLTLQLLLKSHNWQKLWGINYSNRFHDTAFNRSYPKRFLVTKL